MPQDMSLTKQLTTRELFYFFGRIYGMENKKIAQRLEFLIELVEIENIDATIEECSGGQQRRISFVISLLHNPEILFLDEPTVGLDPVLRMKIWEFLISSTREKQLTVVITTHYIEHANQADCVRINFYPTGDLLRSS